MINWSNIIINNLDTQKINQMAQENQYLDPQTGLITTVGLCERVGRTIFQCCCVESTYDHCKFTSLTSLLSAVQRFSKSANESELASFNPSQFIWKEQNEKADKFSNIMSQIKNALATLKGNVEKHQLPQHPQVSERGAPPPTLSGQLTISFEPALAVPPTLSAPPTLSYNPPTSAKPPIKGPPTLTYNSQTDGAFLQPPGVSMPPPSPSLSPPSGGVSPTGIAITPIATFTAEAPMDAASEKENAISTLLHKLRGATCDLQYEYLKQSEALHIHGSIKCPKATAIKVANDFYLHANRIDSTTVGSQMPLQEAIDYFWNEIFKEGFTIVDLTVPEDLSSEMTTGIPWKYYPETIGKEAMLKCRDLHITLESDQNGLKKYRVTNLIGTVSKEITRFHFSTWRDNTLAPLSIPEFASLVETVEKLKTSTGGKLWVHCRAGVGRTGTMIGALKLKTAIATGIITKDNLGAELSKIVLELRRCRGPKTVREDAQFRLLYYYAEYLLELSSKK